MPEYTQQDMMVMLKRDYAREMETKRALAVSIVEGRGRNAEDLKNDKDRYQYVLGSMNAMFHMGMLLGINLMEADK